MALVRKVDCRGIALAAALLLCAGSPLSAQTTALSDPPAGDAARPGDKKPLANDPELRKQFREVLARRLESRKRETDAMERALKLLDEGKTLEELRTLLPDLPRFGQRGEGREQWQHRLEQWGGPQGGPAEDVNRLGTPGGGGPPPSMGNGPGAGIGKPPEAPRQLTEEDRTTVREVLAKTAPETLTRLQELEKSEPAKADQQYLRSLERMRFLIDLRKRDPQMFELKAEDIRHSFRAMALARSIGEIDKAATPDTALRQEKVEQLRKALRDQYEVRTRVMQREVDKSADRAADMAKEIEKRPAMADEVVDKNLRDMIEREHRRRDRPNPDGQRGTDRHTGKPGEGRSPDGPPKQ